MTIGEIFVIVIIFTAIAVGLYLSNKYVPPPWKWFPIGILILVMILYIVSLSGVGGFNTRIR